MNQDESLSPELQPRLDEVIAAYLRSIESGMPVDREALLARHPELANHLRTFFLAQDQQDADAPTLPHGSSPGDAETLAAQSPADGTSPGSKIRYFGDYELIEEIARGGMGVVYKARQVSLNRTVALKMILAGQFAGDEDVRRFYTEAEAAANLDHPGIVPIFEVGEHEGQHYFSMGYVEGQSLAQRVADGPLPPREAAKLVMQVAEAISYAHDQGVIHRDLKPGNILLDRNGQPRVTDFGLAKRVEGDSDLTATGQVVGTPSYMPPEQASGRVDQVGPLADVYSLGAVLYTLLTGRPPFQSANKVDTLLAVLNQDPASPRQLNPAVPRDLETICLKCLRKEPGRRYASANGLADDLARWLENKPILARPVSRVEKAWLWCKRRPAVASMLVVLLVAAIVVQQIVWQSRRQNDRRRAVTLVEAVLTAPADGVPYAIEILRPLREQAMPTLRKRMRDSSLDPTQRLHAAFALAEFGEGEGDFLIERIAQAPKHECRNVVAALRRQPDVTKKKLNKRIDQESDPKTKARLAIVLLHIGDPSAAASLLKPAPDPIYRTTFIHLFPSWHGDTSDLARVLKTSKDSSLRSGLCFALGLTSGDQLSSANPSVLKDLLLTLYRNAPDRCTHSASGWTLRQWKIELPILDPSRKEDPRRDWWVNTIGMTLLRIPAGTFTMGSSLIKKDEMPPHEVTITKPLWLSDREVTVDRFLRFVTDEQYFKEYPNERPIGWLGNKGLSPTRDCPVQGVSWSHAILFCNWLSRKEGLYPCYRMNGREWTQIPAGTGYRLPTEAEWEYACRAGSAKRFCFGDEESLLGQYAVYGGISQMQPCGSKLPNAWGLFDMHGNVYEWCQDWYVEDYYNRSPSKDPPGPEKGKGRVLRGGSLGVHAPILRSASRYLDAGNVGNLHTVVGFRVARIYE